MPTEADVPKRPNSESQKRKRKPRATQAKNGKTSGRGGRNGETEISQLKVIGGECRGRRIEIPTLPGTRPMKNRTREAMFNLLGQEFASEIAVDFFAGSGIVGIEAVSRGCQFCHAIELSSVMVGSIRSAADQLGVSEQVRAHLDDAFSWSARQIERKSDWQQHPLLLFFCPPYQLWHSDRERMQKMVADWVELAITGSAIVCELDDRELLSILPDNLEWDCRRYAPAELAIAFK